MRNFLRLYFKTIAILLIIVGLSFSITSLNKLYGVVFFNHIIYEEANLLIMSIGILFPVSMFVSGIYLYFNLDYRAKKLKILILVFSIIFTILGLFYIIGTVTEYQNILKTIFQTSYFLNETYGYISCILGLCLIYGVLNYRYLLEKNKNYRKEMRKYGY